MNRLMATVIFFVLFCSSTVVGGGFSYRDENGYLHPVSGFDKIVATGNCVDIAASIVHMLKRNYVGFDRVQVAVSENHVQAVLDDLGVKQYLVLKDNCMVVVGEKDSVFDDSEIMFISGEEFLKSIIYYRPSVSKDEFIKFIGKPKEGEIAD